jgi:hypothetical protein
LTGREKSVHNSAKADRQRETRIRAVRSLEQSLAYMFAQEASGRVIIEIPIDRGVPTGVQKTIREHEDIGGG